MQFHRVFTLVLVNAFIKDLNGRSEIILTKSEGDITLEYSTTMLESSITIQYHLDKQRNRLKKVMQFSRKECTYRAKNNQLHDTGSGMIAQTAVLQKRYAVYNGLLEEHQPTLSLIAKKANICSRTSTQRYSVANS